MGRKEVKWGRREGGVVEGVVNEEGEELKKPVDRFNCPHFGKNNK